MSPLRPNRDFPDFFCLWRKQVVAMGAGAFKTPEDSVADRVENRVSGLEDTLTGKNVALEELMVVSVNQVFSGVEQLLQGIGWTDSDKSGSACDEGGGGL